VFDSIRSVLDLHHHHFTRFQKKYHDAMDATSKLLLDEMTKMREHIDSRFNSIDRRLESLEKRVDAVNDRIKPLEETVEEFMAWQQGVDASVADLASKLDSMEQCVIKVDVVDGLKH
jgi:DNA repair ATPase RecN